MRLKLRWIYETSAHALVSRALVKSFDQPIAITDVCTYLNVAGRQDMTGNSTYERLRNHVSTSSVTF